MGLLLSGCASQTTDNQTTAVCQINEKTTVSEIVHDERFEGYGQFIFPIERGYDESLTINHIDSLLPYHSHINTQTTIDVLNYMTDHHDSIFHDIYTDEEKSADPSKENTGLFFFKGEKNAPFAIINAGGGFSYVGSIHESFPHALYLSQQGYNAFALQYRTGGGDVACEDLSAAIAFIFEHADELEVNTDNYSLWGGSAGARMAAYLGSYGTESFGQDAYPRAGAIIMQYTGHSDYTTHDPATYVCVGENDGIALWQTMQRRIQNLKNAGIDTEFHRYPSLGHGFGLGIGTSAEGWIDDAIAFWQKQIDE